MILLASIGRPGILDLSRVSVVRALSAGNLSFCREGGQISGIRTCLLSEDEGQKQGLSQKLLACAFHTLTWADQSCQNPGTQDGSPRCFCKALLGGVDTSPLARKVSGCLEPETWSPQKLCGFHLSQKLLASAVHTLTYVVQSWRNLGTQDGSPKCCGEALPGGVGTSPLAGKVPRCLEFEIWHALEALWLPPNPEAVSLCSPHSYLSRPVLVVSLQVLSIVQLEQPVWMGHHLTGLDIPIRITVCQSLEYYMLKEYSSLSLDFLVFKSKVLLSEQKFWVA
jgi:hypothetical protein